MPIRVDSTKHTHVVYCTDCPSWAALRLSKLDGLVRANEHERTVHPGQKQASTALAVYAHRLIRARNVSRDLEALLRGILRPADGQASDRAALQLD